MKTVVSWEILRRGVTAAFDAPTGVTLHAPRPLSQATNQAAPISGDSRHRASSRAMNLPMRGRAL